MSDLDALASDFGRLFLRLHRLLDRRMARSGASLARTKVLMLLDREGPLRATDIAELFGLAPRTVTESLDALERAGLLRREPDPADRRVKRISITGEGRQAVAATEPLRLKLVDSIFGALAEGERAQLAHIVASLSAAVEAEEAREGTEPLCPNPRL
jgi:DNA-binding MarR family transcriptional regulator